MALVWDDVTNSYIDDGYEDYYISPEAQAEDAYNFYELRKFEERVADNSATPEEAKTLFDRLTGTAKDLFKQYIYNPSTGAINAAGIATGAAAIYGLLGGNQVQTGGYNKPIPKLTAIREQIPYAVDPNRRPGEAGRSYFINTQYTAPENAAATQTAVNTAAQRMAALATPSAKDVNPYEGKYKPAWNPPEVTIQNQSASDAAKLTPAETQGFKTMAAGGLAAGGFVVPADVVAHLGNGSSNAGLALLAEKLNAKPIKGDGDGMSDSIPTHIDGKEKALVANDEAYIDPAMVKRIGGGDTKSGADKLLAMMERIRKARTGNPEQGKRINPEKFMPGGIAQLAGGGTIQRFTTGAEVKPPALGTSTSSSLSPYAGDYVTNYLGKGQALAEAPYQTYGGPLTAGPSNLQNQAFAGISSLASAGYTPSTFTNQYKAPTELTGPATQFTNQFVTPQAYNSKDFTTETFGNQQAQQYMNPYLQQALDPQIKEARRQYAITQSDEAGKMTKSGAFGGSRQAILEAEGQRNLGTNLANITGKGYDTAYQQGMAQFNADQARQLQAQQNSEQSRQFGSGQSLTAAQAAAQYGQSAQKDQEQARQFGVGQLMSSAQNAAQYGQSAADATEASRRASAEFGLKSLGEAANLGAVQRGIETEGINADKQQFEEQRDYPYKMVQYQKDLLQGLPITSAATTANTTGVSQISDQIKGLMGLYQQLAGLGQATAETVKP